jgi:hypothetical protein
VEGYQSYCFEELLLKTMNLGTRSVPGSGHMYICYVCRNVDERMNGGERRSRVLDEMRLGVVLSGWMSALIVAGTCHMLTNRLIN